MGGSWQPLNNQPALGVGTMLLLTDGTVLAVEAGGKQVCKLVPDEHGDYENGSWVALASMAHTRLYFASAVLADGRVFVAGGEYSDAGSDTTDCTIYDPVLNTWSALSAPSGWSHVGDAPCCVLPNGKVLLGSIDGNATVIFDPATDAFTPAAAKDDSSSEETWTLLPDETVMSVECSNHPRSEKYLIAADRWTSAGDVPVELVQASSIEIGPALVLPDGRLFAIGATGNTALYTPPPVASEPGSWQAGPTFPNDANGKPLEAKDAPACLLPNGNVLCSVAPAGEGGSFPGGTRFFEYDGSALSEVAAPGNASGPAFAGRMLLLPSGQVLYANGSADVELYTPDGAPDEDWRPEITDYPHHIHQKQTHTLRGRLFNGLSQACSYGDDATMATNYPIVRIRTASGRVVYCRTFYHSTMGIATGQQIHSTHFKVPFGVEHGAAELCVIANGIESECVRIFISGYRVQIPINATLVNRLIGSLADGPLWVLGPHGPVPVEPWGPDYERRARAAWKAAIDAVGEIEALGSELADKQASATPSAAAATLQRSASAPRNGDQ